MLRGRYGPWQTQGCSEVPDPTKQRALMHQENTDLSASGADACFITAAEPFHSQWVGSAGVELSRDSPVDQRIDISFVIQGIDGGVDFPVKGFGIGERPMCQMMCFEIVPNNLNIVEFGRVLG
jgi:hypothetical protein